MSLYNRFLVFCIFALFIMVTFTGPVFASVNPTSYSYEQFQQKYVDGYDIMAGIVSTAASHLTVEYTHEENVRSLPFYQKSGTRDIYWFSTFPAKFWNSYYGCALSSSRDTPLTGVYSSGDGNLSSYRCGYSPAPVQSSCELAVLLSSPDRPIINSGGDLFVSWSVSEVSSDICYDSCLYDKSTATVSTCYQSDGQTTVGYCNFGVSSALDENNQPSTCSSSNDYSASKIGTTPVGGGDTGGGDTGGGDTGGGGDGSGGDVFVTGGELDFVSSGDVFVDPDLALEIEETKFDSFLQGALSDTLGGDDFGEFKTSLLSYSSRGSCPALSFDFLGVPIYSDTHCVLFEDVRGLLSLIFMAAWTFLGIRIALSA